MRTLFERTDVMDTTFRYTQQWLQQKYNEYNAKFFGNQLPKTMVFNIEHEVGDKLAHANCGHTKADPGDPSAIKNGNDYIINLSITVSDYYNNMTEKEAEELLIHEMIHIWQYTHVPLSIWENNDGHGSSFTNKMDEINKRSNGEFNITVTNDINTKARHDNNTSNQRSMYQSTSDKRMLVMVDPHNENNYALKQFKNEFDMNNFINNYAKMHDIEVLGTGKPHDLDLYAKAFNNIKDSTPADNSGYYMMPKQAVKKDEELGALTIDWKGI